MTSSTIRRVPAACSPRADVSQPVSVRFPRPAGFSTLFPEEFRLALMGAKSLLEIDSITDAMADQQLVRRRDDARPEWMVRRFRL